MGNQELLLPGSRWRGDKRLQRRSQRQCLWIRRRQQKTLVEWAESELCTSVTARSTPRATFRALYSTTIRKGR